MLSRSAADGCVIGMKYPDCISKPLETRDFERLEQGLREMADDQVFIIRCWDDNRDQTGRPPEWRARVEHTNTGAERHFANLPSLCEFIEITLQRASRKNRDDLH